MRNGFCRFAFFLLFLALIPEFYAQDKAQLVKALQLIQKRVDSINSAIISNEENVRKEFAELEKQKAELENHKKALVAKEAEITRLTNEMNEKNAYIDQQEIFFGVFVVISFVAIGASIGFFSTLRDKKKINKSLEEKNELIKKQVTELKLKTKEITDSLNYAKKIQDALLPSKKDISEIAPESFVFFRPKDIVSGDFYWFAKKNNRLYVATADCTGHGVPGSLMSMLGMTYLDKIVVEKNVNSPQEILNELKKQIIYTMSKSNEREGMKDGMDMSLYSVDMSTKTLTYSAANNGLYIIRDNAIIKLDPDKQPVGSSPKESIDFTGHRFDLKTGDLVVSYSDGYADQFGGKNGKKYKYKQLQGLLLELKNKPLSSIPALLNTNFEKWKGPLEQVDDVLIIGLKV